jgi:hypothetical protein
MTESIPGGPGQTAQVYQVANFSNGMARLAQVFLDHPELVWLRANTNPDGHVDIIVNAGTGVLHAWVHALPSARRKQDLYSLHSGAAIEEILTDGPLTVHVRRPQ